jgi:23S rRNA (guanosine2251-2'-O)-methyltransferase
VSSIIGLNPVREALRANQPLDRVLVAKGAGGPRIQEIVDLCRTAQVPVRFEPRATLDKIANGQAHQAVIAFGTPARYSELSQIGKTDLIVILDGVEDPHNLGAIIRTANAAGAGAVIIPERRAAPLTDTVAKAAAGAVAHTPVVRVGNITRALEELKEKRFWIYGLDERGTESYTEINYNVPTAFVLGGEGKGLHELVKKHCDALVRIPMAGAIASLNVSVAAGVVLFEWRRRLSARGSRGEHKPRQRQ